MRAKKAANRDLPPRMIRRVRALKGGKSGLGTTTTGGMKTGSG